MTEATRASAGLRLVDEQLRRASARMTQSIALRFGERLGMWVGCGYPRSGTVWLCQLLSSYLDLPHPRRYRLPVAMPCVVHAHWLPDPRLPRTVYIVRDGRDVMVSRYFYEVRLAASRLNPAAARQRRARFDRVLGPRADLNDVEGNMARFVEVELSEPGWPASTWPQHVDAWLDAPLKTAVVRYEDLRRDVHDALSPALEKLGETVDAGSLRMSGQRFEFGRQAGLQHDGWFGPVLRRGVPGDWKSHFSREAATIFDQAAGRTLRRLGYESLA